MTDENLKNITNSDSNFAPTFINHHVSPDVNFNGYCLMHNIYIPRKVINIYIFYTLNPWLKNTDLH